MNDLVELGLRKPASAAALSGPSSPATSAPAAPMAPASADSAGALRSLLESFLRLMVDVAPGPTADDVQQLVGELEDYRAQIALADHDQELRRLGAAALRTGERLLRQSHQFYTAREQQFVEMIMLLRQTARHLAGESADFASAMRASTDRVRQLTRLDNIQVLRRQIAAEADTLQRTIEAKLKREEEAVTALTAKVETLESHLVQVQAEALTDPLTKVANRGAFDKALTKAVQKAKTDKSPLTLAMLDIDHFKRINDTHGHLIGDRVLLCAAQWLSGAVRSTDLVARYGGEEFALILPGLDVTAAEARLTSALRDIANRSFEYDRGGTTETVRFTMSGGLTQLAAQDTSQEFVQRADQALYEAKRQGRNRVVVRKRSRFGGLLG